MLLDDHVKILGLGSTPRFFAGCILGVSSAARLWSGLTKPNEFISH